MTLDFEFQTNLIKLSMHVLFLFANFVHGIAIILELMPEYII
jgi:hypothetical protein